MVIKGNYEGFNYLIKTITVDASACFEVIGVVGVGHLLFLDVVDGDVAAPAAVVVRVAGLALDLVGIASSRRGRGTVPVRVFSAVFASRMLGHPLRFAELSSAILKPNLKCRNVTKNQWRESKNVHCIFDIRLR